MCQRCFALEETLATACKAIPQWWAKEEGLVDDRTEAQKHYYSSPDVMLMQSMCPPKDYPELGLHSYDPKTGKQLPGKTPASFCDLGCHEGTCTSCPGHNGVHANRPMQTVDLPKVTGGKAAPGTKVRGAPVEYSDDEFTWHQWRVVARGGSVEGEHGDTDYDPQKKTKARTAEMWLPITGTRRQFMAYLHATFRSYRSHVWGVRWHRQCQKVHQDYYGLQVAAGTAHDCQKGAIRVEADFAAKHKPARLGEITCMQRDDTHVLVLVLTHDCRLQQVSELATGSRLRSRLEREGVESYHTCDTTVVYTYSNAPHNAAFYHSALAEAVEVVVKGRAPADSKGEWIYKQRRLANSCNGGSLAMAVPAGQAATITQMSDQAEGDAMDPPLKQPIDHVYIVHDGCCPQFTGGNAQLGVQRFGIELKRRLGRDITVSGIRLPPGHGKSPCDGANKGPKAAVENGRRNSTTAVHTSGTGSRSVFLEAAFGLPEPTTPRAHSQELHAHTNYVYGWFPDDGSGFHDYQAAPPYHGIGSDTWHAPHPGNVDPDDSHLVCRLQPCFCSQCLQGNYADCLVPGVVPGNAPRHNQLALARRVDKVHRTRRVAAQDHGGLLKMGTKLVMRIHSDEVDDSPEEPYCLALCVGKAYALSADVASKINPLRRGRLVVKIRWLHHPPDLDIPGHRTYTRVAGEDQEIWPVDCAVAALHYQAQEAKYDTRTALTTACFRLPLATHDEMVNFNYGAELLA